MENTNKFPLMYGIIDSDGAAYIGENCVASCPQELFLELNGLNDSPDAGYKIVALGQVYLDAAAPQVVVDERAAQRARVHAKALARPDSDMGNLIGPPMKCELPPEGWYCTRMPGHEGPCAALASAPVQAQEPVAGNAVEAVLLSDMVEGSHAQYGNGLFATENCVTTLYRAPVQPVAVPDAQIVLNGHQLRMALDLINPGGPDERDELDDQLLFGIRQHRDDDGNVSTDMCCWNGDTDGVLPLDGEYEASAAPAAQGDAKDTERYSYIRDTRTLDSAVWAALEGYGYADEGDFDQAAYAAGLDQAIDAAIAAKAAS